MCNNNNIHNIYKMGRAKKYNTEEERIAANREASRKWYYDNINNPKARKCCFKYEKCEDLIRNTGGSYCQYHAQVMFKANKYKITPDKVLEFYKVKDCHICGNELSDKRCIDHNHTTGVVRDIICHNCNVIIGLAKENTSTLDKIIKYIKQHEK